MPLKTLVFECHISEGLADPSGYHAFRLVIRNAFEFTLAMKQITGPEGPSLNLNEFSDWGQALTALTRAARRETLRDAVLRFIAPLLAARINSGCAALSASFACAPSPASRASSTLRTNVRTRLTRLRLTSVRRAILRVAFLADLVLAIVQLLFE